MKRITAALSLLATMGAASQPDFSDLITQQADALDAQVIAWRRDFHQHPELGNREVRTAAIVARHLTALGYEVQTGVAHTGVVGVLRGALPGPTIALRADMDALPIEEKTGLPFASTATGQWGGKEVPLSHACGHDAHVAILMGVAQVLASIRERLPGTVVLLFQPAEEGTPAGEEGGAKLMVEQGVFTNPVPAAVIALHVAPDPVGDITYTPGAAMASADHFEIRVRGKSSHGAEPWAGVDPIVTASQIVLGLQTIVSRQSNLLYSPAVVTVGSIHGGTAGNAIPDEVVLQGTIRTLDADMRLQIQQKIRTVANGIASSAGAEVEMLLDPGSGYPVTVNDVALTTEMVAVLKQRFGEEHVYTYPPILGSEDFSFFAQEIPGFYFYLGIAPEDKSLVHSNHSSRFYVDERGLKTGVIALSELTLAFLQARRP